MEGFYRVCTRRIFLLFFFVCLLAPVVCKAESATTMGQDSVPFCPPATDFIQLGNGEGTVDISHVDQGYLQCKYAGSSSKVKVQITRFGDITYTYNLNVDGQFEVFPLSAGNGTYQVTIYEQVRGNQYALVYTIPVEASLHSPTAPFLYPNQYVQFAADSAVVKKARELASQTDDEHSAIYEIYHYVVSNIRYDEDKAEHIQPGYLPNVDTVLSEGQGICFDYAALTAAMLRSQGIPTQMQVGYVSSGAYHAWINVYFPDVGWTLMDPTFAANGNHSKEIVQGTANSGNYRPVYTY